MESCKNGNAREQGTEALQKKLDLIKQLIRDGVDVWRNRQRKQYLERRLARE